MALACTVRAAMNRRLARQVFGLSLWGAGLFLLTVNAATQATARPEADAPRDKLPVAAREIGRLVRVPLPITGNADTHVKRAVQKALSETQAGGSAPVLVFEFASSQNQTGQGSDFSRALALARYLSSRELSEAKTVAYIPKALRGHAVLVAMACEEIIMAPDAQIGEAGIDEPAEEPVDPTVRSGYNEIANRRRTIPAQVALGMLDKNVEVLKIETEVSPEFVLRSELDEFKKQHTIQSQKVVNRPGQFAQFSGAKRASWDSSNTWRPIATRWPVRYRCPWACWRTTRRWAASGGRCGFSLRGPMTGPLAARVQRMIEDQIREQDANFVCLWIDSPGGSIKDSMDLANYLADLDPAKVRTVAYVPAEARADAALVAWPAINWSSTPEAIVGGAGAGEISPEQVIDTRVMLRDRLARKNRAVGR